MLNSQIDENLYYQDLIFRRCCLNCCIFHGILSWNAWNVNWRQRCNCSVLKTAFVGRNFLGGRADISIQDLEEKLFEHAPPFIWGPPQMCYAGDVNGSCPQCTECYYGCRETILALWVTCLSGMKKQDKFLSLTTYLKTWIKFLHCVSFPQNLMWRMSMGQEMSQHPEYYAFRSGFKISQCLRLTSAELWICFGANRCHWCGHKIELMGQ